ncbi:MAG: hypothetical protein EZS28_027711 [Streblomastix strix]|uniref:Uncharacterized protein n=1 Tax=Streblomastix strix TaxID=222440 RepID=A0A5J4V3Y1_9EUKA|nr:MAG: hypothetical protein EZS28_027711 [Streblomastix strix]
MIPIINTIPDYILDKYIKVGYPGSYDSENIYVGISPLTSLPPNSSTPVRTEYRGYYELKYPLFPFNTLVSATLNLTKATGIYPGLSALSIIPSKVTNLTYSEITGQSNIITTPIALSTSYSASPASIALNITSPIRSNLENGVGNLIVELRGSLPDNTYANTQFVNIESITVAKRPTFVIVAESSTGLSPYGNAGAYVATSSDIFNCFGYAIEFYSDWLHLFQSGNYPVAVSVAIYQNLLIPAAMNMMNQKNTEVRIISALSSDIAVYERRIAFRVGRISTGVFWDFHFMKEHSNGSWSHKPGRFPSILLPTGDNPNNGFWGSTGYDSTTTYFAINHIQGGFMKKYLIFFLVLICVTILISCAQNEVDLENDVNSESEFIKFNDGRSIIDYEALGFHLPFEINDDAVPMWGRTDGEIDPLRQESYLSQPRSVLSEKGHNLKEAFFNSDDYSLYGIVAGSSNPPNFIYYLDVSYADNQPKVLFYNKGIEEYDRLSAFPWTFIDGIVSNNETSYVFNTRYIGAVGPIQENFLALFAALYYDNTFPYTVYFSQDYIFLMSKEENFSKTYLERFTPEHGVYLFKDQFQHNTCSKPIKYQQVQKGLCLQYIERQNNTSGDFNPLNLSEFVLVTTSFPLNSLPLLCSVLPENVIILIVVLVVKRILQPPPKEQLQVQLLPRTVEVNLEKITITTQSPGHPPGTGYLLWTRQSQTVPDPDSRRSPREQSSYFSHGYDTNPGGRRKNYYRHLFG